MIVTPSGSCAGSARHQHGLDRERQVPARAGLRGLHELAEARYDTAPPFIHDVETAGEPDNQHQRGEIRRAGAGHVIGVEPSDGPINAQRFVAEFLDPADQPAFSKAVAAASLAALSSASSLSGSTTSMTRSVRGYMRPFTKAFSR